MNMNIDLLTQLDGIGIAGIFFFFYFITTILWLRRIQQCIKLNKENEMLKIKNMLLRKNDKKHI